MFQRKDITQNMSAMHAAVIRVDLLLMLEANIWVTPADFSHHTQQGKWLATEKAPFKLNETLCHLAQTLVIKRPDTNIPYTVWPNSWPHLSLAKISPIGEHLEPVQVTNDQWIICTAGVLTTLKVPGKHCQQL